MCGNGNESVVMLLLEGGFGELNWVALGVVGRWMDVRLTDAGLLSMSVMSATVESAIMSFAALESHSSRSSCSATCFTSTAPITYPHR